MSDAIGKMWRRVEFLKNVPVSSGAGNKDGYELSLTTRGELVRNGGNREAGMGDINGFISFTLRVRKHNALTALITMSLKIRIDGQVYTIHSWDTTDRMYDRFNIYLKNG